MHLKLLKTFDVIQGDEKTIKVNLDLKDDLSTYKVRFIIKEYNNAKKGLEDYLLSKSDIPIIYSQKEVEVADTFKVYNNNFNYNYFELKLLPEETAKFPVTRPNKPLVIGIGIYKKDEKYSKELHLGLNVHISVNNNLY